MIAVRPRIRRSRISRTRGRPATAFCRQNAPAAGRTRALVALSIAAALVVAPSHPAAGQGTADGGPWVEPVGAPVVDGYRPPAHIGAPGNRGWEYRTEPGTVVVAAGDGVVVWAGPVGGSDYVSIQHPDGRRTTYSHVATIGVDVGDVVSAGEAIATSGERLHFGVRVGDEYRDPGELFAAAASGGGGVAPLGDGLRLIPPARTAGAGRTSTSVVRPILGSDGGRVAITAPAATVGRSTMADQPTALGRWFASVELEPVRGAWAAQGWSGDATDTLADGPR